MLYFILGLLGIIGGILSAIGDVYLDQKGPDNEKLGEYKVINSAWAHMDIQRFRASISLAAIGVPLYSLGLISLMLQASATAPKWYSITFTVLITICMLGAFFIHAFLCLVPIVHKTVSSDSSMAAAEHAVNEMFFAVTKPLHTYFYILGIVPTVILAIGMFRIWLSLSPWWLLLTPIPLMIYSGILRKINPEKFCDFPGILIGSLGMSMYGVFAIVNML